MAAAEGKRRARFLFQVTEKCRLEPAGRAWSC